jgi:hypothetical protein
MNSVKSSACRFHMVPLRGDVPTMSSKTVRVFPCDSLERAGGHRERAVFERVQRILEPHTRQMLRVRPQRASGPTVGRMVLGLLGLIRNRQQPSLQQDSADTPGQGNAPDHQRRPSQRGTAGTDTLPQVTRKPRAGARIPLLVPDVPARSAHHRRGHCHAARSRVRTRQRHPGQRDTLAGRRRYLRFWPDAHHHRRGSGTPEHRTRRRAPSTRRTATCRLFARSTAGAPFDGPASAASMAILRIVFTTVTSWCAAYDPPCDAVIRMIKACI